MRPRPNRRPDGAIRASQLLTTAGPGALVDLVHDAVLVKGLASWRYEPGDDATLREDRLAERVSQELRAAGLWKGGTIELRRPPLCDDQRGTPAVGIHVRPYPSWYVCQHERCSSMVRHSALQGGRHPCRPGGSPVIPVRFLVSCRHGHLGDVPWRAFLHRFHRADGLSEVDEAGQPNPYYCHESFDHARADPEFEADLIFETIGSTGDIADFQVVCRRCGDSRNLRDLPQIREYIRCGGYRPWLPRAPEGGADRERCEEPAELLVRTASNTWFPRLRSALSIPDLGSKVRRFVGDHLQLLQNVSSREKLETLVELLDGLRADLQAAFPDGPPHDELLAEIVRRRHGVESTSPWLREPEWHALMGASLESSPTDIPDGDEDDEEPWFARRLDLELPPLLDRVVLVHTLREVRALIGFCRLDTPELSAEGDQAGGVRLSPLAVPMPWVPAVEIRGEGVFLALREEEVRAWERREVVLRRHERFVTACDAWSTARGVVATPPTPRLLLLHSLAHLLISTISLSCGYPASAIRERIYCAPAGQDGGRAGILLYTGTPGAEGTLGGLVQVGRDILRHLDDALRGAVLCSHDPSCAARPPDPDHGRHREGAACHGCLHIAEPSCERMNRDLDRALVVPVVGMEPGLAFFGR